jgi:DNA mismatch repair protein MutL
MDGQVSSAEIARLPEHVANQIAAGEVVQRPASVAKELLENAIDAGATEISLDVVDAGRTRICVSDNGRGMGPEDAEFCFERHATSKISSADDLLSLVTKGFRGEALSSIASVAQVTLKTRRPSDELAVEINVDGGVVSSPRACTAEPGSRMEVRNLFYNVPARRNFLKSDAVEMRHLIDEFHRVALPHPEISFVMRHGGKALFNLPAGALRQRVVHIFGPRYDQRLVPIDESTDVVGLSGFVGKPEHAKRTRGEQFLFVNGRFIKHPAFHSAIMRAMDGLLLPGQFPFYVLFLEVNPARIDVNIHPTKVEANFTEQREIVAILGAAVKRGLGRFQVAPALDFDQETAFTLTTPAPGSIISEPQIKVDANFNPFTVERRPAGHAANAASTGSPRSHDALRPDRIAATQNFFEPVLASFAESPPARPMFQLFDGWIVTTTKAGLVMIDQHRAHARILFDTYTASAAVSQQLLFPASLECPAAQAGIVLENLDMFRSYGFDLDHLGGADFVVRGIPQDALAYGNSPEPQQLIDDMLAEIDEFGSLDEEAMRSRAAAGLAKSAAIKKGKSLTAVEMRDLIDRLFACEEPGRDPWGRPTIVTFDRDMIAARFG